MMTAILISMNRLLFSFLATLMALASLMMPAFMSAQNVNQIEIRVNGLGADTVYLANYYGAKMYYADTTVATNDGRFRFDAPQGDKGGKYAAILPGNIFIELVITGEEVKMTADLDDLPGSIEVKKSVENKLFYNYLSFIGEMREARAPIDQAYADSTISAVERESLMAEMSILNEEVVVRQKELVDSNPEALFAKMLQMVSEEDVPEAPEGVEDARTWQYYYYRSHFWDRVDLSDPRLVRDPAFHGILDQYWNGVLPQMPDSMLHWGIDLIDRAGHDEVFKYILHYMTYASESSKIMCMDLVFVNLVDRYYRKGKATWMVQESLDKVLDRADDLRYTMCGHKIPNITLPDVTGQNWISLYDIDANFTIVSIWESNCGHCKVEMPKLKELYKKWHDKGVEVYAIGNDFETEPWIKFLEEQELTDWINVSDNPQINATDSATVLVHSGVTDLLSLNFRATFDVFATPKLFLLDRDKVIVAKQIGADQLGEILDRAMSEGMFEGGPDGGR